MGEWLHQALQARQQTLRDLYLAEVIEHEEWERKRKKVTQTRQV